MHSMLLDWSQKYGGVFKVTLFGKTYLVVSTPEALQEVLVTRGKDFAGRPDRYRSDTRTRGAQLLLQKNLALHKAVRQISQSVLNLYGRGRGRLEIILDAAVDNLIDNFHKKTSAPFDAWEDIYEATTMTVVMLVSVKHSCLKQTLAFFFF